LKQLKASIGTMQHAYTKNAKHCLL